ncbi:hypothetical protein CDL15_Pgr026099 [Punica granatum]|uniref:NAC domain-containing protein n=1 Tax=Punica granatum TaxID=22663 RepID=A0A218WCL6_PUNGR|nr:hypothetical protein CDL15_Pgr026099 [Punica granatum]PKI34876.1 hypothetical protein CRG98_044722 [Punica granatum]
MDFQDSTYETPLAVTAPVPGNESLGGGNAPVAVTTLFGYDCYHVQSTTRTPGSTRGNDGDGGNKNLYTKVSRANAVSNRGNQGPSTASSSENASSDGGDQGSSSAPAPASARGNGDQGPSSSMVPANAGGGVGYQRPCPGILPSNASCDGGHQGLSTATVLASVRSSGSNGPRRLPDLEPGFRFCPTDDELVLYYLKRKVLGKPFRCDVITSLNIYAHQPWDLPDKAAIKSMDLEWFFFTELDRKFKSGDRVNRDTGKGFWKTTGNDRVITHKERTIGLKRTLVYHSGYKPDFKRTDWVMHEFRLSKQELERIGVKVWLNSGFPFFWVKDTYVMCRVFHKEKIGAPTKPMFAPFIEEEWDDARIESLREENMPEVNGNGTGKKHIHSPREETAEQLMTEAHARGSENEQVENPRVGTAEDPMRDENGNDNENERTGNLREETSEQPMHQASEYSTEDEMEIVTLEDPLPKNNDLPAEAKPPEDCPGGDPINMEAVEDPPVINEKRLVDLKEFDLNVAPMEGNIMNLAQDPPPAPAATAAPAAAPLMPMVMEIEQGGPSNPRPAFYRPVPEPPVHPQCMSFVNGLQEQFYKAALEKEELKLETVRLRQMLSNVHVRADQLAKENEALRKKLQEVSAFFR